MRPIIALAVALLACSKASYPELSDTVAADLKTLAPTCDEKPGNPGPPHGYSTEITCRRDGDTRSLVFVYLVDQNTIGQIHISLAIPAEQAIAALRRALRGLIKPQEMDQIADKLRIGPSSPRDGNWHVAIPGVDAIAGIADFGSWQEAQLTLWWNP